jgi:hypothetical protein
MRRWIVLLALPQLLGAAGSATEGGAALVATNAGAVRTLAADCVLRAAADTRELATLHPICPANAARLKAIAAALQPPAEPLSWGRRFNAWIAQWFEANRTWPSWLRPRWAPGDHLWSVLMYTLAGAVVLGAVAVVAIEVRAAGVLGRRDGRRRRNPVAGSVPVSTHQWPELTDIEAAPLAERPVLVLRLLVAALARSHRLERDRSLTCRELITAARFDSAAQREQFMGFALLAERALYEAPLREGSPSTFGASAHGGGQDLGSVHTLYEALLVSPGDALPARP